MLFFGDTVCFTCRSGRFHASSCIIKDAEAIWQMQKVPVVELSDCIECDCCVEICPEVFTKNEAMGYIEVVELEEYPELDVQDAIKFCPTDCIGWEYI